MFHTKLWFFFFFFKCKAHKKFTVKVQFGWTHIGPETTSPHLSTRKKHDETVTSTNTATCNSCRSLILRIPKRAQSSFQHIKKKNADSIVQIRNLSHTREKRFLKESNTEGKQNFTEKRDGAAFQQVFSFWNSFFFFFFSDYNFQFYAYMKTRLFTEKSWGKQILVYIWSCKKISNLLLLEFSAGFSRQPNGIKGVLL